MRKLYTRPKWVRAAAGSAIHGLQQHDRVVRVYVAAWWSEIFANTSKDTAEYRQLKHNFFWNLTHTPERPRGIYIEFADLHPGNPVRNLPASEWVLHGLVSHILLQIPFRNVVLKDFR